MSKWWLWVNERYHQQPAHTGSYMYEVQLFQLAVIGTILWKKKKKMSERYQHQQPAHVKVDCST